MILLCPKLKDNHSLDEQNQQTSQIRKWNKRLNCFCLKNKMEKSICWSLFCLLTKWFIEFQLLSLFKSSKWSATADNSNFRCEQGHVDGITSGVRALRRARCQPRCDSTWFIHLEGCRCLLLPLGLRRRTKKEVILWSRGCFPRPSLHSHISWFPLDVSCQRCPWTSAALFRVIPCFYLYSSGEDLQRTLCFPAWI